MKVAHVNYSYGQLGSSGTEQSVPNTCSLLEERGIDSCVLYECQTGPPAEAARRRTYQIPGLCQHSLFPEKTVTERALAVLEAERVDVVHLHQINNEHLVQAIAARWPTFYFVHNHILTCPSGTRVFMTSWELCPQPGPAASCLVNAYTKHCGARRPSYVLGRQLSCLQARVFSRGLTLGVDSQYMKATLVTSGYPDERIVVTPTVTEIVPPPDDYFPAHDPPRILYVGQLSEIKGLPLLLESLSRLTIPARLQVAGEGYLLPPLRRRVAELGLTERVTFLGHASRGELAALLRESAVLAVPTRYPEPFGLVGPEAMAHARPVVAFAIGGIPEWLEHEVTGLLAQPNDLDDFTRKLERLLLNPAEARQMGQAGRRVWEQRFHPRYHVATLISIYTELCARAEGAHHSTAGALRN
jgi:glycosyltransferase involved in cell wall biosynthesis